MRKKISDLGGEVNDDATANGNFTAQLPPALQRSMAALIACLDDADMPDGDAANVYFGDCLSPEDCGSKLYGTLHVKKPGSEDPGGLFYGTEDHKLAPLFRYVGCATNLTTGLKSQILSFSDNGKETEIIIPFGLIAQGGAPLASYLTDRGFFAPVAKSLREQLQALLNALGNRPIVQVASTGWLPGKPLAFALPDGVIGHTGKRTYRTDTSAFANLKIAKRGTLKGWQKEIATSCSGNSRLILAVSTAFASPLLRFAPAVGSTVVHFFGESSTGKTTAARVAGSVWGGSDDSLGFAHSWNATLNSHIANAVAHSGTLLALDELRMGEGVSKAAYALASGQDRGRLDKSASQRRVARFETFLVSTGEPTLDEADAHPTRRQPTFGGAEIRLPSIPADADKGMGLFENIHVHTSPAKLADSLTRATQENFGHAGPAFVEALVQYMTECDADEGLDFSTSLSVSINAFVTSLKLGDKADDAVKRLARTFGLIAAAGRLASEFEVVPVPADEMEDGVRRCFLDWIKWRGGTRSKTTGTALISLRDYISQNVGRFVDVKDASDSKPVSIVGYVERPKGSGPATYYLLTHAWKEVMATAPRAKLVEELDRLGLLKRFGQLGPSVVKKVGGSNVRVYAINGHIEALRDDGLFDDGDGPLEVHDGDDDDDRNVVSLHDRAGKVAKDLKRTSHRAS